MAFRRSPVRSRSGPPYFPNKTICSTLRVKWKRLRGNAGVAARHSVGPAVSKQKLRVITSNDAVTLVDVALSTVPVHAGPNGPAPTVSDRARRVTTPPALPSFKTRRTVPIRKLCRSETRHGTAAVPAARRCWISFWTSYPPVGMCPRDRMTLNLRQPSKRVGERRGIEPRPPDCERLDSDVL